MSTVWAAGLSPRAHAQANQFGIADRVSDGDSVGIRSHERQGAEFLEDAENGLSGAIVQ